MSKQRAKGTAFETAVVNYLRDMGYLVERTGSADYGGGDIKGLPDWLVECKNHKAISLAEWVDQAELAAGRKTNGEEPFPVVVVKRRNRNVRESYVVMPLWAFAEGVL